MNETLCSLIADIMDIDQKDIIPSLSREEDDRWDSLNHLRLVTAVEEEFSIRLTMDEIEGIVTAEDVNRLISQHRAAQ